MITRYTAGRCHNAGWCQIVAAESQTTSKQEQNTIQSGLSSQNGKINWQHNMHSIEVPSVAQ